MANFNQDRRSGGRPSFGGSRSGGGFGGRSGGGRSRGGFAGRDGARPQMHSATCAECGDRCEVPFKPTGDKPVYCSNCFGNSPNYGSARAKGRDRDFDRRDSRSPQMHRAVCAECGDDCEVPFKPNGDKPVYCSNCFGGNEAPRFDKKEFKSKSFETKGSGANHDELKEEVKQLHLKMDKILTLLQRTNSVKEVTVMKAEEAKKSGKEPSKTEEKTSPKKVPVKKAEVKKPALKKVSETNKKKAPAKKVVKKSAPKKK